MLRQINQLDAHPVVVKCTVYHLQRRERRAVTLSADRRASIQALTT